MQIKNYNEIAFHTHQMGKNLNFLWYQSMGDTEKISSSFTLTFIP